MSYNLQKKPSKGILKTSRSVDGQELAHSSSKRAKEQRFDESNIIETFHPANKDYGHMKIDEPKTPYAERADGRLSAADEVDANLLAAKLAASMNRPPRCTEAPGAGTSSSSRDDSDSDPEETQETREHREEFQKKRKMHYNEFQALQLARRLMAQEEDEDDESQPQSSGSQKGPAATL